MILITGIAGFIGSATARQLVKDGEQVIGIDNFNSYYDPQIKRKRADVLSDMGIEVIDIDLKDDFESLLSNKTISKIIHIAASAGVRPSIDRPLDFIDNNIFVTTKVLEFAKNNNIKDIVFASSSSVYGNMINDTSKALKEEDIEDKIYSPYAATKLSNEVFNHTYANLYGLNIASLRYFTVYGPDQRPDLAIIKFSKSILNDKPIDKYGTGETFRDYTYINDVVDANLKALNWLNGKSGVSEIFNISSGNPVTLNELIVEIENATNKKAIINQMDMQLGDVYGTYGDNSKARKILNWEPKMNLSSGIEKTIDWLR